MIFRSLKLRNKFAPKLAALQEQLRKAFQRVEKEKAQANQQTMNMAVSLGSSILGAVFGRKLASATNIGRAATTIRGAGRVANERQDVALAEESVEAVQKRIEDLNSQFETEANAALLEGSAPESVALEEISVAPKKTDVTVIELQLCWTPWTVDANGNARQAW